MNNPTQFRSTRKRIKEATTKQRINKLSSYRRFPRIIAQMIAILPILNHNANAAINELRESFKPSIGVTIDGEGYAQFDGDGVQYLTQAGEPKIPFQIVTLLLPPNADVSTLEVSLDNVQSTLLPTSWEVRPTAPESTWDGAKVITAWPPEKTIVNGRDIDIYEVDNYFPSDILGTPSSGLMHHWKMLEIPVAPYQYNPVSKQLLHTTAADIVVSYMTNDRFSRPPITQEEQVKNRARNFE